VKSDDNPLHVINANELKTGSSGFSVGVNTGDQDTSAVFMHIPFAALEVPPGALLSVPIGKSEEPKTVTSLGGIPSPYPLPQRGEDIKERSSNKSKYVCIRVFS
jgi:hypothetical protein